MLGRSRRVGSVSCQLCSLVRAASRTVASSVSVGSNPVAASRGSLCTVLPQWMARSRSLTSVSYHRLSVTESPQGCRIS